MRNGAISVTPEELKNSARVYDQAAHQLQEAMQRVKRENGIMQQEWQGQAFTAYLSQYEQLSGQVTKMEQLLQSITQQLQKYATTVAERDQQDSRAFGLN